MSDENPTQDELRARGFTETEIAEVARIGVEGVRVPSRDVVHLQPVSDPLIAFFWARLDEAKADAEADRAEVHDGEQWRRSSDATLADVAAKKAVLDDYARYCADVDNPARELICQVTRDVIKRLATVYAGHPDYSEDFRP